MCSGPRSSPARGRARPDQQERFVTAYRAQQINLFRPRLLVDGGDRFAYLWEVTSPEGTVRTGADVNVLRGAPVKANRPRSPNGTPTRPIPTLQPTNRATQQTSNSYATPGHSSGTAPPPSSPTCSPTMSLSSSAQQTPPRTIFAASPRWSTMLSDSEPPGPRSRSASPPPCHRRGTRPRRSSPYHDPLHGQRSPERRRD